MAKLYKPEYIFLHCSASDFGYSRLIDEWHKERKIPFREIGYHFTILNGYLNSRDVKAKSRLNYLDGSIEVGRPIDSDEFLTSKEVGAHVKGWNHKSLGICFIGNKEFKR